MKHAPLASALAILAVLATHAGASAQSVAPATPAARPSPAQSPQVAPSVKPNVLVWMMDDVGFAQVSSYGGLVETPNIDRIASRGLRYTNYHTPPICSASRAAFLTGRNAHSVHVGSHAAAARPFPGYDAKIPAEAGTVAENLRQQGYVTFAIGKWDHLPAASQSATGPYTYWPLGQGFDRFYGFLSADTDNWAPVLVNDNAPAPTPEKDNYHLSLDLSDEAIEMIEQRSTHVRSAPFFMYLATGAAHAPHHAPSSWLTHYRGRFNEGWDVAREKILANQISLGIMPAGTALAARPDGMPEWNSLSPDQKRLYARQMEAFAASLSFADEQFGRILDTLEAKGELDNTIVVITSDNGASAEGAEHGTFNENNFINGRFSTVAENMPFLDRWGGPATYPHYALGWAVAGNTPFRYYKQTTFEGGTRVPLIISPPRYSAGRGGLRTQFTHVTDIAPTILDIADVDLASVVNDVTQSPMEGESIAPTFANPQAPLRRKAQYFEMFGNRGLWSDGWMLVGSRRTRVWDLTTVSPPTDSWELYDLGADPGQQINLAGRYPERVASMAREFEAQAGHTTSIQSLTLAVRDHICCRRSRTVSDSVRASGDIRRPSRESPTIPPPRSFIAVIA